MIVKMLIEKFIITKNTKPANVNQLLDFATLCYINSALSLCEYKLLMRELVHRGATKPEFHFDPKRPVLIC